MISAILQDGVAEREVWTAVRLFRERENSEKTISTEGGEQEVSCQHCGCASLFALDGLVTCVSCSSIVDRVIDYGAEWRYYGAESDKSHTNTTRCCPPTNSLVPTMGSIIGMAKWTAASASNAHAATSAAAMVPSASNPNHRILCNSAVHAERVEGGDGSSLPRVASNTVSTTSNLQKYQFWNSMTYRERTLCSVFEHLSLVALQNGIPQSILDEAKSLYKKMSSMKVTRGDNRTAVIACSMYMACKVNRVPRSTREIAEIFGVSSRIVTKGCKLFEDSMDLNIETSCPEDFVRRFCSRLHMNVREREFTELVVSKADELEIVVDFIPTSVAAAAIFMTNVEFDIGLSKAEISGVCHVSHITITKCYKRLREFRSEILSGVQEDHEEDGEKREIRKN